MPHPQVHKCGVLHNNIRLRNLVLASHLAAGGSAGGDGGSAGGGSVTGASVQQQPRILLIDFRHAELVEEVAEETGEEPAVLFQRERGKLEELLGWEPQLQAADGQADSM